MPYRTQHAFGLDIGDRSLKALQFHTYKRKIKLSNFAEHTLPEGIIQGGVIQKPDELAQHIKELLHAAHIRGQYVVTALPEAKTFLKLLKIPLPRTTSTQTQLLEMLAPHLPYELEEVWTDVAIIDTSETVQQVLFGAAPKNLVTLYSDALIKAGLLPVVLTLEPLAITRALIREQPTLGCTLIVDIGATKSTLILATHQTVIATADGKSSAMSLTNNIAKALKLENPAVEEMKYKYGMQEGSEPYRNVLNEYASTLLTQIRKVIEFSAEYESYCPGISQILVSGGGARLKGLPEYLTSTLKLPTRLAQPWLHVPNDAVHTINQETSLHLTTVCGLALIALDTDHIL